MKKVFGGLFLLVGLFLLSGCNIGKVVFDSEGTYDYEGKTISKDVYVMTDGVVLKNAVIESDLYIDAAVGNGHIEFYNIDVKGTLYVYGGGLETIYIHDGMILKLIGYVDARVEAASNTIISEVVINEPGMVLESDETALEAFPLVSVNVEEPTEGDAPVILDGNFEKVNVSSGSYVEIKERSEVQNMTLVSCDENCATIRTRVRIEENARVQEMNMNNECDLNNAGEITKTNYGENVTPNGNKKTSVEDDDYEPQIISEVNVTINQNNGDYTLEFQANNEGKIYYVVQPYFETTEKPDAGDIESGDGLQNSNVESQLCTKGETCMFVVSAKSIDVAAASSKVEASGYMGDKQGNRPPSDDEIEFDSVIWYVFKDKDGNYSDVGKVISK